MTRAGRARMRRARGRERHPGDRHGEPARHRAIPSLGAFAQMLRAGRLRAPARQAARLHAQVRRAPGDRRGLRVPAGRSRGGRDSSARGAPSATRLVASARADASRAVEALTRGARERPAARSAWRDEVRAAIAYRPAAWDAARRDGAGTPASGAGAASAAGPARRASRVGAGLRRRRVRPMGAGLPRRAAPRDQRRRRARSAPALAVRARRARGAARCAGDRGDGRRHVRLPSRRDRHRGALRPAVRRRSSATTRAGTPSTRSSCATTAATRAVGCELLPTRYDQVCAGVRRLRRDGHERERAAARRAPRARVAACPPCLNVMIEGLPAPNVKR